MKKMNKTLSAVISVLAAGNLCFSASAASTELAETMSKDVTVWGSRKIVNDVYKEIDDLNILPEKKRDSVEAIRVDDHLIGLAFRVDGTLPETIGNYHVYYFQDYFPYDQEKHDAFSADDAGCFIASYSYYEAYLENRFSTKWAGEGSVTTPLKNISNVDLSDTDSVVVLMLEFPTSAQSEKDAYFLGEEAALMSCSQLSYLGEARRIEETYYYNTHNPLRISCTDADAALGLLDSEVLAPYDNKRISRTDSCEVVIDEVSTDDMRTLRAAVRQDPRVVSAQIEYSALADAGADACLNGIYTVNGDVNSNGAVELADALTALQAYSDTELMNQPILLTDAQFVAADMDGDGKVTIGDALTILQIYTDETLFNQ